MAKWYNAYLDENEQKYKQISSKGITARRRKQQSQDIAKDINSGAANKTQQILRDAFKKR